MKKIALIAGLACALALSGCNDRGAAAAPPPPQEMTASAFGHYCGMNVLEHPGPKGQIILASQKEPVWFSSARDTITFTMLPEEPKDIEAIYVSDMAKAPSWDEPGASNWVDARQAVFVIGSRLKGGMGGDEAVPFSDKGAAERFAAENGGHAVAFVDIPRDYILNGTNAQATGSVEQGQGPGAVQAEPPSPAAPEFHHSH